MSDWEQRFKSEMADCGLLVSFEGDDGLMRHRGGNPFQHSALSCFIELIYVKAAHEGRKPDDVFAEHKAVGEPTPDSGHAFWSVVGLDEQDQEKWARELENYKRAQQSKQ